MKILNFNKADGGLTVIIVIVIILIFIGWLVNLETRECNSNKDCGSDKYCGSDFSCHQIPVIERTTTLTKNNLVVPSIIVGIAIIVSAIIFKSDKLRFRRKSIIKESEMPASESKRSLEMP